MSSPYQSPPNRATYHDVLAVPTLPRSPPQPQLHSDWNHGTMTLSPRMRADGGSDLPADSPLRQFSYQDSQQQCDNRPVPQLSAAHLHSRNQSDSHVTPDLASASDNEHSPAPAALMVPEHLQLSPTRPALPFPSSSPTYHSSPAHPRIKAPLPNINMAHLSYTRLLYNGKGHPSFNPSNPACL